MNIEQEYLDAEALLDGHFLLASGNHSKRYLQSAKVLEDPKRAELICNALAQMIKDSELKIDSVCAPLVVF